MLDGRVRKVRSGCPACVVDEDVEAAVGTDRELDGCPDFVFARDVRAHESGFASSLLDEPNGLGSALLVEIVDNDRGAPTAERSRDCAAGAACTRSRYERDLSFDLHGRGIPRERRGYARKPSSAAATSLGSVLRL